MPCLLHIHIYSVYTHLVCEKFFPAKPVVVCNSKKGNTVVLGYVCVRGEIMLAMQVDQITCRECIIELVCT